MKNNFLKISVISLVVALMASSANAAVYTPTASGTSNAKVVTPIAISAGANLEFGAFAAPATTSGTITQAGAVTGGVVALTSGTTRTAGAFSVTGDSGSAYTFTLPSSVTLTRVSGSETMSADLSFASGTSSRSLTGGTDSVTVNGSLAVAAAQVAGNYTGTYTVSVNY